MIYFISGHRDLTREEFNEHYTPIINRIIELDSFAKFIMGDWEGCDTLVYNYILPRLKQYQTIDIYYVDTVRFDNFNKALYPQVVSRKCDSYEECDASMIYYSDFDIAWIRPGKENSHTANNVKRRYGL